MRDSTDGQPEAGMTVPDDAWLRGRVAETKLRAAEARKRSKRRRGIDPTTCERDYTESELQFFASVQSWRNRHHSIPTAAVYLAIAAGLGYRKPDGNVSPTDLDSAIRDYRSTARRPFPTLSEILELMTGLGMRLVL